MKRPLLQEALDEIRLVRQRVERIERIVEERLVGVERPSKDEEESIRGYQAAKKPGSLDLRRREDIGTRR